MKELEYTYFLYDKDEVKITKGSNKIVLSKEDIEMILEGMNKFSIQNLIQKTIGAKA